MLGGASCCKTSRVIVRGDSVVCLAFENLALGGAMVDRRVVKNLASAIHYVFIATTATGGLRSLDFTSHQS